MNHNLNDFLNREQAAGKVMAHARLLLKLSRRFAAIAPGGLHKAARVANFKAGLLVIHADNGAVASKLRQMGLRISRDMSQNGVECSGIEVKVQPRPTLERVSEVTLKPLSGKAVHTLRSTAENLPQGKLREALDRLLARAATAE